MFKAVRYRHSHCDALHGQTLFFACESFIRQLYLHGVASKGLAALYCTSLHCTKLFSTALHCSLPQSTLPMFSLLHGTALHGGWLAAGLLRRVVDIPDKEVVGDEATQLRRATAFNFPAILASAGREQWPLLQPAHQALLQAADPAVRKTLACSLHELARLLGPQQALRDLGSTIQVSMKQAAREQAD